MCIPSLVVLANGIKGETSRPLKARLEKHQKAVISGETVKSDMADQAWGGINSHQPPWNEVKIPEKNSEESDV